jgi:hypothetical protein
MCEFASRLGCVTCIDVSKTSEKVFRELHPERPIAMCRTISWNSMQRCESILMVGSSVKPSARITQSHSTVISKSNREKQWIPWLCKPQQRMHRNATTA